MECSSLDEDYLYGGLEIGESQEFQLVPKIKKVGNLDCLVSREFGNNQLNDFKELRSGYKVDHVISFKIVLKAFNEYIIKNSNLSINLICSIGNNLKNVLNHRDNLCYVREPINRNKEIRSNINNTLVRKYLDLNYQYVLATVNKFKGHSIYCYLVNSVFPFYYPKVKLSQVYIDLNESMS